MERSKPTWAWCSSLAAGLLGVENPKKLHELTSRFRDAYTQMGTHERQKVLKMVLPKWEAHPEIHERLKAIVQDIAKKELTCDEYEDS